MYTVHLFALDWEHKQEWTFKTINEAEDYINNLGSKWIFFPLVFVGTNKYILTKKSKRKVNTVSSYIIDIVENNHIDDDSLPWIHSDIYNS